MKNLDLTSKCIFFLAVVTFFSNLPTYGGEDIANARKNALSDYPIDFWGGISSFFYSRIPDFPLGWAVHLLLFQISITTISLVVFAERNRTKSKKFKFMFLTFSYFCLVFGSSQTRDGLMFALTTLALATLFPAEFVASKNMRVVCKCFAAFLLVFAFSFRPWVSLSCSLVLAGWYLFADKSEKKLRKIIISSLILTLIPGATLAFELAARKVVQLHTIYPEQQVISMDLGAAYCWSTNTKTVLAAREALSLMYLDQNPGNVCESFKPINWIWFSRKPIIENDNSPTTFSFLTEKNSDQSDYLTLRSRWLNLIFDDPSSYIQNKYMLGSQVFIAGDSRYVRVLNSGYYSASSRQNTFDLLVGIFLLPWDLVISLHLLSMQFAMFVWLVMVIRQYKRHNSRHFTMDCIYISSFFIWLVATVIAYIGDNGRYTYSASLALMFTIFLTNRNPLRQGKL